MKKSFFPLKIERNKEICDSTEQFLSKLYALIFEIPRNPASFGEVQAFLSFSVAKNGF
ncbi:MULTISPECIES: hypothetical protein [unclassified Fibrobacter]|uniref:hypothetical protein n=1 Tax=unclassified Fibrobacter TaxID=2634177 RepID=UPI0013048A70|nr:MULTISPECIES: hypothetical protein [unclassified Fibrobacter]